HAGGIFFALERGGCGGRAETGNTSHILGAGAHAALLPAATDQGIGEVNVLAPPYQRADALGTANLVRREGEQISAEDTDRAGYAPGRLHGIDMQQATRRMDDRGRPRDRLHHAALVVGEHERDERPYRVGDGSRERG